VELPPSPALAPWVACYWSIRATDAPSLPNRVLPDGCADIIVGISGDPQAVVVGAMRTAAVVSLAGRVDMFGVRFRPGGAWPFLGVALGELTDGRVPLDALRGAAAEAVAEAFAPAPLDARVARAEQLLQNQLRAWVRERRDDEELAARAVSLLRRTRGGAGVRQVAAALGVGERRLGRAFDRFVGLSPKVLGRVLRFRQALREIERGAVGRAQPSWTAVAFAAGYADQPHFIREFKALAGVTPVQYAAERRAVGFVQYREGEPA
jgi:AraC-like DNA-binding protein